MPTAVQNTPHDTHSPAVSRPRPARRLSVAPAPRTGPELVGAELTVPLVTGEQVPYANFDYAASAPCLRAVRDTVEEVLPWYSSVHRGAGFTSQVSTRLYERARGSVRRFVNAWHGDAVVFTRNTTDSLNLLASALPAGTTVVVFETEHHANLLPWPARRTVRLPAPASPEEAVAAAEQALVASPVGPRLLCVTAASNVTGELWPVEELAEVAHRHGARIAVDAAQLVPHRRIDMIATGVDYLAFSGHKLYAPYGAGVLVGRVDWLRAAEPYLRGGGASRAVRDTGTSWADVPERHEAGTPNVLGAVALATACDTLAPVLDQLAETEEALLARARAGLARVPGLRQLGLWPSEHPRVSIISFVLDGWDSAHLAAALSAEYGIGVRDGRFCAHLFTDQLVAGAGGQGSAVRASLGIGTTAAQVDRLVRAVHRLATTGANWRYETVDGRIAPSPDPRPLPAFLA